MNKLQSYYYKTLHIALLLLKRDFKKLSLSFISLIVGAVILTFILSAQGSLGSYIQQETKALVGGDITVRISSELKQDQSAKFNALANISDRQSLKITTNTIVRPSDNSADSAILSFITAVSDNYPVYGEVLLSNKKWQPLNENEIYAEKNLLDRLELSIGDSVKIGSSDYIISGVLESLPDQLTSGFSFGPRVIISDKGFDLTGIDKSSSRIGYRYDLALEEYELSEQIKEQLIQDFKPVSGRVNFASEGAGTELAVLDNIKKFLITLSVLTLFLVVINVRSTMSYLFLGYRRSIALYKVLGMTPTGAVSLFIFILTILALISGFIGVLLGNVLVNIALPIAEGLISAELARASIFNGLLVVVSVISIMTILGALSILVNISKISPKEVLSSENRTKQVKINSLETGVILFSVLVLVGMVWFLSGSMFLSAISVVSLFVIFSVLTLIFFLFSKFIYKIRFTLPTKVRYISNFINARGALGLSNYAALVMALTILFSITGIENALQENIEVNISRDAPNLYLIDIQKDQQEDLKEIFPTELTLFPNVRGRLLYVDETDIQKESESREYTREFNNTYRTELIEGEELDDGSWHGETETGAVSVDERVAKDLGIKVGSEVTFGIQGREVSATVTSLRSTEEAGFGSPFFYFVFSPDVIGQAPQSSFGFSFIDSEKIPSIQNVIAERFPNISTIPTNDLFDFVIKLSGLFSQVLIVMSVPALVLGSLLVWSQLLYATRERLSDLGLFKVFGMTRRNTLTLFISEMLFLVLGSVIFAFILSRIAIWSILKFAFDLPMIFAVESYFYLTSIGAIIIVIILVMYFIKELYSSSSRRYFLNK